LRAMGSERGVIFDLDGVLINSEPLHCRAFQEVLGSYGVGLTDREYYTHYIVYSDREVLERLLPDRQILDAAVSAKERRYWELVEAGVPPFQDGLALLAKTDGWRVGLATGSIRREAELALRSLGVLDRFEVIVTREDCRNGKPDPEPFLRAAEGLRLPARQCVAIEDTPGGVEAAKAAGMIAVAVTHSCSRNQLSGADLVVDDLGSVNLGGFFAPGGIR
jgi:HAD superfamily hydrolase (TIGR01509 family)